MHEAVRHDSSVSLLTGQWVGRPKPFVLLLEVKFLFLTRPAIHLVVSEGLFCALQKTVGESKK